MIEQDAVRRVNAIGLTVIHRDPVGIELCSTIRAARPERRVFVLWYLGRRPKKLRCRCLIEAGGALEAKNSYGLEKTERPECVRIRRVLRRLETDLHMTLGRKIVDLVGFRLLYQADETGRVRYITVMHGKFGTLFVWIGIKMIDPSCVEGRRAALDPVDTIISCKQEFGEIGAVLTGDSGNQGFLSSHVRRLSKLSRYHR